MRVLNDWEVSMVLQARQVSSVNAPPPPPGMHLGATRFEAARLPRQASDAHLEEALRPRHGDRLLRIVPPPASTARARHAEEGRPSDPAAAFRSGESASAHRPEFSETSPRSDAEASFLDRATALLVVSLIVISIGLVPVGFGAVMRAVTGSPAVSNLDRDLDFRIFHP
jgi:hypothetical protein